MTKLYQILITRRALIGTILTIVIGALLGDEAIRKGTVTKADVLRLLLTVALALATALVGAGRFKSDLHQQEKIAVEKAAESDQSTAQHVIQSVLQRKVADLTKNLPFTISIGSK